MILKYWINPFKKKKEWWHAKGQFRSILFETIVADQLGKYFESCAYWK